MLVFWLFYQVVKHIHLLSMVLLKSEWYSETKYSIQDCSEHKSVDLCQTNKQKNCFMLPALKFSCAMLVAEAQWENCILEVIMKSEHL